MPLPNQETIQAPILTVRLPFAWPLFEPRATPSKFFSFDFKNNFLNSFSNVFPTSVFLNDFKSSNLSSLEFLDTKIPFSIKFGCHFLSSKPLLNFL